MSFSRRRRGREPLTVLPCGEDGETIGEKKVESDGTFVLSGSRNSSNDSENRSPFRACATRSPNSATDHKEDGEDDDDDESIL